MLHQNPSRHERALTFGPAGRVGVSAMLFVPVAFGAYFSVFFLAAAAVWMVVLPIALHQVWQPARIDNDAPWPLEPLARPKAVEPAPAGELAHR